MLTGGRSTHVSATLAHVQLTKKRQLSKRTTINLIKAIRLQATTTGTSTTSPGPLDSLGRVRNLIDDRQDRDNMHVCVPPHAACHDSVHVASASTTNALSHPKPTQNKIKKARKKQGFTKIKNRIRQDGVVMVMVSL
jgi:hypothetical protein